MCVVVIVIDRNALELCFIVVCSLFTPSFAFTLQKQSSIDIYVYDAYTDTHIYREVRMWKDMRMWDVMFFDFYSRIYSVWYLVLCHFCLFKKTLHGTKKNQDDVDDDCCWLNIGKLCGVRFVPSINLNILYGFTVFQVNIVRFWGKATSAIGTWFIMEIQRMTHSIKIRNMFSNIVERVNVSQQSSVPDEPLADLKKALESPLRDQKGKWTLRMIFSPLKAITSFWISLIVDEDLRTT